MNTPASATPPVDAELNFQSVRDYSAFVEQFITRTLPKPRWTHRAHLVTGLWHLLHYSPEESLNLLRSRISTYNVAVGGQNTDAGGYHETLTRFYVTMISQWLASQDGLRNDWPALVRRLLESRLVDKNLPLEFFSKELLFSLPARRAWVEPDLQPLSMTAAAKCFRAKGFD